jgi:hypothetical protein
MYQTCCLINLIRNLHLLVIAVPRLWPVLLKFCKLSRYLIFCLYDRVSIADCTTSKDDDRCMMNGRGFRRKLTGPVDVLHRHCSRGTKEGRVTPQDSMFQAGIGTGRHADTLLEHYRSSGLFLCALTRSLWKILKSTRRLLWSILMFRSYRYKHSPTYAAVTLRKVRCVTAAWVYMWSAVCVYVSIRVASCVCICEYTCGQLCVYMWVYVWSAVCVYVSIRVDSCVCICEYTCGKLCVYMWVYVWSAVCVYVREYSWNPNSQHTGTWSAAAWPPRRLCYRPAVFFQLRF